MAKKSSPEVVQTWKRHVAEWRRSGLSVAAFCRQRKLSQASFFAWRRRFGKVSASAQRKPAFLPVTVAPAPALEMVLTSGRVLRLRGDFSPARLAEFVAALESAAC